jgi:hypothetical protein
VARERHGEGDTRLRRHGARTASRSFGSLGSKQRYGAQIFRFWLPPPVERQPKFSLASRLQ